MNDLEVRGLKDLIKELMQDELAEVKSDIEELRDNPTGSDYQDSEDEEMPDQDDEEPEPELPPEEPLKDNPQRQEYEKDLEKASEKESGTRLNKQDMKKIQAPPHKKIRPDYDEEKWDEEQ